MPGGVYAITNTATGAKYIGRAVSFARRFAGHRAVLRAGKHINAKLQRAWLKHGEARFAMTPLVVCAPAYAVVLEQRLLDAEYGSYNLSRSAVSPFKVGDKRVFSETHRARIGDAQRGKRKAPRTPEHQAKLSASLAGRPKSAEHVGKVAASKRGRPNPKAAAALLGRKQSADTRAKRAAWWTRERCAARSAAYKGRNFHVMITGEAMPIRSRHTEAATASAPALLPRSEERA